MSSTSFKQIEITHVVNPHLFWFKYMNQPGTELAEFERKLEKYVIENLNKNRASESDGKYRQEAFVAVYLNSMKKWVRAEIDAVDKSTEKISVWAIDYGFPLITTLDLIVLLSVDLKQMCSFIKSDILKGGVADIMSASSRFKVMNMIFFLHIFKSDSISYVNFSSF